MGLRAYRSTGLLRRNAGKLRSQLFFARLAHVTRTVTLVKIKPLLSRVFGFRLALRLALLIACFSIESIICLLRQLVVIINGEIVPDSDPRARTKRGQSSAAPPLQRTFGARVATVGGSSAGGGDSTSSTSSSGSGGSGGWGAGADAGSRGGGRASPAARGGGATSGPLQSLEAALGIEGRTVTAPAIGPVPSSEVPLVYLAVVAAAALLLQTWKVPVGAAGLYYLSKYSELNPAQRPGGGSGGSSGAMQM